MCIQVDFPESIRNGRFAVQPHVDQELDDSKLFLYIFDENTCNKVQLKKHHCKRHFSSTNSLTLRCISNVPPLA